MIKMKDIAKLAGVSRSAVSIAINNKPGISQKTREKIFKIIKENNYHPLRKRKGGVAYSLAEVSFLIVTGNNGMVEENYRSLPFFDSIISNLTKNISSYGGSLQIQSVEAEKLKSQILTLIRKGKLKNTIVLATDLTRNQVKFLKKELGVVVFIDTYYPDISADFITMDNFQGAYNAGKFILSKGYKSIGYVASNKKIPNFQNRRCGFYKALENQKVNITPDHFFSICPLLKIANNDEIIKMFKNTKKLPDALFCEDDYIAIRLIKELKNLNIDVPNKIAIMGFDDIYMGQMISPSLTTVHVPIQQIVRQVIFQLQEQVARENWQPQKCLITTNIIERESL